MPVFATPNNRSHLASYDNSMTIKICLHEEPMNIEKTAEWISLSIGSAITAVYNPLFSSYR